MGYLYRYFDSKDGTPLTQCPNPHCNDTLIKAGSIRLWLVVAGHHFLVASSLRADGSLVDTEDHAVAKGFHGETQCARCGRPLIDYEFRGQYMPSMFSATS